MQSDNCISALKTVETQSDNCVSILERVEKQSSDCVSALIISEMKLFDFTSTVPTPLLIFLTLINKKMNPSFLLLVELARLYTCRLQKSLDLSANVLPFLVMRVAYPISVSRLSSQFARVGSCTHIPFLVIYIDYLMSVRFLPRVSHNCGLLDFNYSGNTKI